MTTTRREVPATEIKSVMGFNVKFEDAVEYAFNLSEPLSAGPINMRLKGYYGRRLWDHFLAGHLQMSGVRIDENSSFPGDYEILSPDDWKRTDRAYMVVPTEKGCVLQVTSRAPQALPRWIRVKWLRRKIRVGPQIGKLRMVRREIESIFSPTISEGKAHD